jgi:hypothetical protein
VSRERRCHAKQTDHREPGTCLGHAGDLGASLQRRTGLAHQPFAHAAIAAAYREERPSQPCACKRNGGGQPVHRHVLPVHDPAYGRGVLIHEAAPHPAIREPLVPVLLKQVGKTQLRAKRRRRIESRAPLEMFVNLVPLLDAPSNRALQPERPHHAVAPHGS